MSVQYWVCYDTHSRSASHFPAISVADASAFAIPCVLLPICYRHYKSSHAHEYHSIILPDSDYHCFVRRTEVLSAILFTSHLSGSRFDLIGRLILLQVVFMHYRLNLRYIITLLYEEYSFMDIEVSVTYLGLYSPRHQQSPATWSPRGANIPTKNTSLLQVLYLQYILTQVYKSTAVIVINSPNIGISANPLGCPRLAIYQPPNPEWLSFPSTTALVASLIYAV
mgnify:CR=1 FL=1